jgi:hypothetical protein
LQGEAHATAVLTVPGANKNRQGAQKQLTQWCSAPNQPSAVHRRKKLLEAKVTSFVINRLLSQRPSCPHCCCPTFRADAPAAADRAGAAACPHCHPCCLPAAAARHCCCPAAAAAGAAAHLQLLLLLMSLAPPVTLTSLLPTCRSGPLLPPLLLLLWMTTAGCRPVQPRSGDMSHTSHVNTASNTVYVSAGVCTVV